MLFTQCPPRFGGKPGEPVPQVDPDDVKAVWHLHQEVQARHPGQLVAIAGIGSVCTPRANLQAVGYRVALLGCFIHMCEKGKLATSLLHQRTLSDEVFREVAQMKAEWIGDGIKEGFPFDVEGLLRIARGENV